MEEVKAPASPQEEIKAPAEEKENLTPKILHELWKEIQGMKIKNQELENRNSELEKLFKENTQIQPQESTSRVIRYPEEPKEEPVEDLGENIKAIIEKGDSHLDIYQPGRYPPLTAWEGIVYSLYKGGMTPEMIKEAIPLKKTK